MSSPNPITRTISPSFSTLATLLFLLSSTTSAISLSNFTPRLQNLPSTCHTAYTSPIPSCSASDFGNGNTCSKSCIEGLVQTSNSINRACAGVDVPETSIVGVFLIGQGVQALCNVRVETISSSSRRVESRTEAPSSAAAAPTSVAESSTTASGEDGGEQSSTSSAEESSTTPASSSPTPTTSAQQTRSSLIIDPSPSSMRFSPVTSSVQPSRTASSQKSNQDSGGGSPFDVQATGDASRLKMGGVWGVILGMMGLGIGLVVL